MDKQTISERARKLVKSVGTDFALDPSRCWLDGNTCPYGEPQGRLDMRPESWCTPSGCDRLRLAEGELYHIIGKEQNAQDTDDYFSEHSVMFSSQLTAAAEHYPEDSPERSALELAADILMGTEYNERVLLERDIPRNRMVRCSGGP